MYTDTRPLRFPQDILRFLYWVFFKPITLHRYIYQIEPVLSTNADLNLYKLWQQRKVHPEFGPIICLSLLNIVFMPLLAFPLIWVFQLVGIEVNWFRAVFGVGSGILIAVLVSGSGDIAEGITFGLVLGLGVGLAGGMAGSVVIGVVAGMAYGVGMSLQVGRVVVRRMAGNLAANIAIVAFLGVMAGIFAITMASFEGSFSPNGKPYGIAYVATYAMKIGMPVGMAGFLACIVGYYRLFFYVFQFPLAWIQSRFYTVNVLFRSPVFYDEVIWFPLPGLDSLLVNASKQDRKQGLEAIAFVASSFNQGWAAKRALLELTAYDVIQSRSLEQIADISGNLVWLPDDTRMDLQKLLLGLEQTGQHARAALESETLYNQQEQLRLGLQVIEQMRNGLAYAEKSELARTMLPALEGWKTVFTQELAAASGLEQIPNVYHSGTPLIKESKTFKGRRDLFRALGNELVNPSGQRPALLLFGARRMGKSSTLKQLPVQLGPQIIPATLDLQSSGVVESTASLLYLLAREITRSARQERRLSLPDLSRETLENDPYLAFQDWLEQVEQKLGEYYWVLLALDEFEALGEMLAAGRTDERIFATLRGLMQNHPRITVLMSGAHTLEELPVLWSNYLINTKMLKVGPLAEAEARDLILHPIPNFPLTYDEEAVELLLRETGCHPNWLQCACREVVETLNHENRFHATRSEVAAALARVPQILAGDFKDLWEGRDSSDLLRTILKTIAAAKAEALPEKQLEKLAQKEADFQKTLEFLLRRDLIIHENGAYRFRAGLLRAWVARQN